MTPLELVAGIATICMAVILVASIRIASRERKKDEARRADDAAHQKYLRKRYPDHDLFK